MVFTGPEPSLGARVTLYLVTGELEGNHLILIAESWTLVTCILDGLSISIKENK